MNKVFYQLVNNALIYIAEEMGIILKNTAYSPNIRDRLDLSCAILNKDGELIAQAEHIPVHLGSMGYGVKSTLEYIKKRNIETYPGDIIIVNNPYIAGTHLNDILALKPIFHGGDIIGFIANKAHHVDVGGKVPGSIGGEVKNLYEEGVVIDPIKLVEEGRLNTRLIREISSMTRTPKYFINDLRAQIASLNVGEKGVMNLIDKYGIENILNSLDKIIGYTERYTKEILQECATLENITGEDYIELPDNSISIIHVNMTISSEEIIADFTGTSNQVPYPLNAVYGVTLSATSYALKSILDPDMPMNEGFYHLLRVLAPEKSMVNPTPPAPVSGGNLETSQRIVDTIYKALSSAYPEKVPAASCGSMNNIMIGGEGEDGSYWAFYETIGGGSGGRKGLDGVDGVHVNMTNTLNTPIEVIEREYPILFHKYELRVDSGGAGRYRGGLGITRMFEIKSKYAILTILCDRVFIPPWGLAGGQPGEKGFHYILKRNGKKKILYGKESVEVEEGDIICINTPGGGGYGDPSKRRLEDMIEDYRLGKFTKEYIKRFYKLELD